VAAVRRCVVSVIDADGVSHSVEVQAATVFEAAAAALVAFRAEGWAAAALTPASVLRVSVPAPAVIHEVPLKALERWARAPSTSPQAHLAKRLLRKT
jgi:hypothetical protein